MYSLDVGWSHTIGLILGVPPSFFVCEMSLLVDATVPLLLATESASLEEGGASEGVVWVGSVVVVGAASSTSSPSSTSAHYQHPCKYNTTHGKLATASSFHKK